MFIGQSKGGMSRENGVYRYEEAYQAAVEYNFITNGGFIQAFSIFRRMNFTKKRKRKR
ncbi:hypothetical protein B4168_1363 [Anoxybacillus flavithermus]|nr:hypothetical protein GT20_1736 [Parageobacillus thermoglucosidasius TNO-09.020]KYD12875.1 hypothetical protein B4168_1363 [Anoxybacillus flavithermus]